MSDRRHRRWQKLAELARAHAEDEVDAARTGDTSAKRAFVDAALALRRPRLTRPVAVAFVAIAAAVVFYLGGARHVRNATVDVSPPLALRAQDLERVEGVANGYRAASGAPGTIRFSDGSHATALAGTELVVRSVTRDGAELEIERGALVTSIVKRSGARWQVRAGPYAVAVTGTRFVTRWDDATGAFQVELHEGAVVVRGPTMADGVRLTPGQRLVARLGEGGYRVEPLAAREDTRAPQMPESASAVVAPPPTVSALASASGTATRSSAFDDWSRLVARGQSSRVVDLARERGVEHVLASGTLRDLVALSEAAHYTREPALERSALDAQRRRFAGSREAQDAAFLLGRLLEPGEPNTAASYYASYLREAPNGAFVDEALGARMVLARRLGDPGTAREAATRYLARAPDGPYAPLARSLSPP